MLGPQQVHLPGWWSEAWHASNLFCTQSFRLESQGKPEDVKFTCKIPSQRHVAGVLPHWDTQVLFCRWALRQFSFYSNFLPRINFTPKAWKHC